MEHLINLQKRTKFAHLGKFPVYTIVLSSVFIVAVFQDYLFSQLQNTGFYISETLLYNTFWLFFIPFSFLIFRFQKSPNFSTTIKNQLFSIFIGATCSVLHILIFALSFVFVSSLVFTPTHRFLSIFNGALSNQFYITFLFYTILPLLSQISQKFIQKPKTAFSENLQIRLFTKIKSIPVATIQVISADRPYSAIFVNEQKLLHTKNLKELENELDPSIFIRVHRSTIINSGFVREMKSRKNGDYDAFFTNGQIIRFSRHYRKNWNKLLQ